MYTCMCACSYTCRYRCVYLSNESLHFCGLETAVPPNLMPSYVTSKFRHLSLKVGHFFLKNEAKGRVGIWSMRWQFVWWDLLHCHNLIQTEWHCHIVTPFGVSCNKWDTWIGNSLKANERWAQCAFITNSLNSDGRIALVIARGCHTHHNRFAHTTPVSWCLSPMICVSHCEHIQSRITRQCQDKWACKKGKRRMYHS